MFLLLCNNVFNLNEFFFISIEIFFCKIDILHIIDSYYKCNLSSKTISLQKSFDPLMSNQVLLQNMIDVCIFKTLCALDDTIEGHTPL